MEQGSDLKNIVEILKDTVKNMGGNLPEVDIESLLLDSLKRQKEIEERHEESARNLHLRQISFLERNKGKRFEISPEFHSAALRGLETSFRYGDEMGFILFFKEKDGCLYGDEFYGTRWIEEHSFGGTTPFKMWVVDHKTKATIPYPLGSFGFNYEKLYELAMTRDELLVACHTHPGLARPSTGDLKKGLFYGIIVGFRNTSPLLTELLLDTFYRKPQWKKEVAMEEDYEKPPDVSDEEWQKRLKSIVGKEILHRIPFDFPQKHYSSVVEECVPTIRLFYTAGENELKRVPLYLDGKELE